MKYKVVLNESEEGFSVSCPGLPGCWSQGASEEEALENIQDAIAEYLAAIDELIVSKIPGVNHLDAVRALEKAGFRFIRQGKHLVMSDGIRILTIPRHNPVNAFTMGGIARDAGLSVEEFKKLL